MTTGSRPPPADGQGEGQAKARGATIFVSDPSAEVERATLALRGAGFNVVDVPLSMLVARVAVQRPRVVLVDADATGGVETIARMRELPDAEGVDVLFIGRSGLGEIDATIASEGSGFFPRPLEVPALVEKVTALMKTAPIVGTTGSLPPTGSIPPPSIPPSVRAVLPPPSIRAERPSQPPPALPSSPRVSQVPSPTPSSGSLGRRSPQTQISDELRELLSEAEERVSAPGPGESNPPTPEEEIEAVLPEDVLAALDEPLEEADEEGDFDLGGGGSQARTTSGGGSKATTGARHQITTGVASDGANAKTNALGPVSGHPRAQTTPPTAERAERTHAASDLPAMPTGPSVGPAPTQGSPTSPFGTAPPGPVVNPSATPEKRMSSAPPATAYGPPQSMFSTTLGSEALTASLGIDGIRPAPSTDDVPQPPFEPSRRAGSVPPPVVLPSVLGVGDAAQALATAIASRLTGTLCFESKEGVRRAVLREGDLVTAASGADGESLLAFLVARGDLPRERLDQLSGRFAAYGRHAGAALVAHGHLRQDQLWTVLRGHAEWILARALAVDEGTLSTEPEAPGRLRGEPSVFGGSTGAEVFVEVVRRAVPPEEALARLGGPGAYLGSGRNDALLTECALGAAEVAILEEGLGHSLEQALATSRDTDMAAVIYALSLLGVVAIARRTEMPPVPVQAVDPNALDSEAVRARVRARAAVVDEGDYFAVLGVARDATGYEIRRAFLDLRREFDPSHLLGAETLDLAAEVRRIVVVLEEAYEILKDGARRERYRRAIEASPEA